MNSTKSNFRRLIDAGFRAYKVETNSVVYRGGYADYMRDMLFARQPEDAAIAACVMHGMRRQDVEVTAIPYPSPAPYYIVHDSYDKLCDEVCLHVDNVKDCLRITLGEKTIARALLNKHVKCPQWTDSYTTIDYLIEAFENE